MELYQNTFLFLNKFRHVFLVPLTLAILLLTCAVVAALGSGTILAAKKYPPAVSASATMSSPNFVSDSVGAMVSAGERNLVIAGMGVYRASASVTNASAQTGRATAHGMGVAARGAWRATAIAGQAMGASFVTMLRGMASAVVFTVKGVGSIAMFAVRGVGSMGLFVLRTPGKVVGSVAHGSTVHAIIRPEDTKIAPVIDSETSAAILTQFNAEQKAKIEAQLAEQIAANKNLDGAVVAGDAKHGGYPAQWDAPVPQDSLIDNWGMYNRECVSYTAWKVYQTYGNMPNWGGVGNANQWLADARRTGIATGSTPQAHSVAISMRGYYGHAMWVEKVSGDMVYVSQYNYDLRGNYSEMWVNASQFTYIYFGS